MQCSSIRVRAEITSNDQGVLSSHLPAGLRNSSPVNACMNVHVRMHICTYTCDVKYTTHPISYRERVRPNERERESNPPYGGWVERSDNTSHTSVVYSVRAFSLRISTDRRMNGWCCCHCSVFSLVILMRISVQFWLSVYLDNWMKSNIFIISHYILLRLLWLCLVLLLSVSLFFSLSRILLKQTYTRTYFVNIETLIK